MRILQAENENFNMYAAFAGDKAYESLRQRVTKIAGYRPYKRVWAALALTFAMVCVTAAVLKIHSCESEFAYFFRKNLFAMSCRIFVIYAIYDSFI